MSNEGVKRRDFISYLGIGALGVGLSGTSEAFAGNKENKPVNARKTIAEKVVDDR